MVKDRPGTRPPEAHAVNIEDYLASQSDRTGECWLWKGPLSVLGYGRLVVPGGHRGDPKVYAHRLSWEVANGPIPKGMCVLHRCDNPPCIRPSHLFLGTRADNSADMVAKGRSLRGRLLRTHCPQGHDYAVYGRFWGRRGNRACSACVAVRNREWRDRKKAAA